MKNTDLGVLTADLGDTRLNNITPALLSVSQRVMLWMEACMQLFDFDSNEMALYRQLRQVIKAAGGYSADSWWWEGPCICGVCGYTWQGSALMPVDATTPRYPLWCPLCGEVAGNPQ